MEELPVTLTQALERQMAEIVKVSKEMQEVIDAWLAGRPEVIQEMARKFPANLLYRTKSGHRVSIVAYSEDRTVRVLVSGEYNFVAFEREAFGVPIDELVECDLPGPDERVGVLLTEEEDVDKLLFLMREAKLQEES